MAGLIGRRLLGLIPLLFIVSFCVFGLIQLVPGDAAVTLAGGENSTPERVAEVRHELHLDEPFLEKYGTWFGNAIQGDFGTSFNTRRPVADDLAQTLPVTGSLVLAASAGFSALGLMGRCFAPAP